MFKGKINIGDIFEIDTTKGKAYFHYIYKDEKIGRQLIRVLIGFYPERPGDFYKLCKTQEQFMIFFPLSAAFNKKIVQKVGYYPADRFTIPKYMRSKHNVQNEHLGWYIIDTNTWKRQLVKELTVEQRQLSDWATWNDTLLIENLISGWSLEKWS